MAIETSLILLKPDCVTKNLCGEVLSRFEREGFPCATAFKIGCGSMMRFVEESLLAHRRPPVLSRNRRVHAKSSPVIALALSGEDVIARVRDLLGPTDSRQAAKGTIRGDLGVNEMVNVCHASDGPAAAAAELERFFKTTELF